MLKLNDDEIKNMVHFMIMGDLMLIRDDLPTLCDFLDSQDK